MSYIYNITCHMEIYYSCNRIKHVTILHNFLTCSVCLLMCDSFSCFFLYVSLPPIIQRIIDELPPFSRYFSYCFFKYSISYTYCTCAFNVTLNSTNKRKRKQTSTQSQCSLATAKKENKLGRLYETNEKNNYSLLQWKF